MTVAERVMDSVVELTRRGWSVPRIAAHLGVSRSTVVRCRNQAGVHGKPQPVITAEQEARMVALAADGASVLEIARTLGVSWSAVARRVPGAVWSREQVVDFAASVRWVGGR